MYSSGWTPHSRVANEKDPPLLPVPAETFTCMFIRKKNKRVVFIEYYQALIGSWKKKDDSWSEKRNVHPELKNILRRFSPWDAINTA
jgi:hypothetical protein